MTEIRERAAEGLRIGDAFQTARTFTEEDVSRFAEISLDYNPVHFDGRFAEARHFSGPICHGLLTASLATEIGGQIGWLASGMSFRFRGPVYVGERITCRWVITEMDENGRAAASVVMTKAGGITVVEGEIRGLAPGRRERDVLRQMLSEGDPTNGLAGAR
ncbi:MAG: MaoC family dehydratase [Desulfococcaceae bacterium]